MSLITCCPNCRTLFKVVADQLTVSDGWVRCGHCDHVFDASAHFQVVAEPEMLEVFDTEVQAQNLPSSEFLTEESPADFVAPAASVASGVVAGSQTDQLKPPAVSDGPDTTCFAAHSSLQDASVSAPLSSYLSAPESPDISALDDSVRSQDSVERRSLFASVKSKKRLNLLKISETRRLPLPEVTFVDSAQRRDQPKRPLLRMLTVLLVTVLLGALVLQVLVRERDALAARYPSLLHALETLCQSMNCNINPPRVLEAIVIDSSSFTQTGLDTYRLSVTLKNTRLAAVAMPALEVTLTGSQNEVLFRKVLLPSELSASSNRLEQTAPFTGIFNLLASLPAVPVLPLQAASSDEAVLVDEPPVVAILPVPLRITGYRLFAFYP